jgi:hypothetical protein
MADVKPVIIFVYNADSGLFSKLRDYAHKIVAPETYECNLCKVTYGSTGMKAEWKEFIDRLDLEVQFYHRDEAPAKFPGIRGPFPAAYLQKGDRLEPFISAEEINHCRSLGDLMQLIRRKREAMAPAAGAA